MVNRSQKRTESNDVIRSWRSKDGGSRDEATKSPERMQVEISATRGNTGYKACNSTHSGEIADKDENNAADTHSQEDEHNTVDTRSQEDEHNTVDTRSQEDDHNTVDTHSQEEATKGNKACNSTKAVCRLASSSVKSSTQHC